MKPADRARLVLQSRKMTTATEDRRFGSEHSRFYRGFVDADYVQSVIRFYPLKRWVPVVGVVDATLRCWLAQRIITAYVMFGMPVMCKAEMVALRDVAKQHNVSNRANTSQVFIDDARNALQEVRLALDSYKRKFVLTDRQRMLIAPSVNERKTNGPDAE